ncbi:hypothetical protein HS1genome_1135 [Sulfodiicoccus acidiphilus]|uniref:VapB-type antitoxin n=1 Tax=Sulfodiicoccus acidiphilus TaxID=1670455 RepID=A0A348B3J4_9CREN|nr:VapB-type antitoxin [Sulfodiicoccus acidiphilus]BBD72746.1 hypothetical protein HS1genome_1135 [Sulfodiicoccus acidiphilus]GGT99523.1 hypothetical protein GCM10007116_16100 [Sulfodiicoccus acidiphilus]
MRVVTIKVKDEYYDVAEEMVKVGLAKSKNEAFNLIISYGVGRVVEQIKRRKRIEELTEKWLKEGLPFDLPTSSEVISDRE